MSLNQLLNEVETAALLKTSRQTLANWRCTKTQNLPFVKIGSLVRYRTEDIAAFIQSNMNGGDV